MFDKSSDSKKCFTREKQQDPSTVGVPLALRSSGAVRALLFEVFCVSDSPTKRYLKRSHTGLERVNTRCVVGQETNRELHHYTGDIQGVVTQCVNPHGQTDTCDAIQNVRSMPQSIELPSSTRTVALVSCHQCQECPAQADGPQLAQTRSLPPSLRLQGHQQSL